MCRTNACGAAGICKITFKHSPTLLKLLRKTSICLVQILIWFHSISSIRVKIGDRVKNELQKLHRRAQVKGYDDKKTLDYKFISIMHYENLFYVSPIHLHVQLLHIHHNTRMFLIYVSIEVDWVTEHFSTHRTGLVWPIFFVFIYPAFGWKCLLTRSAFQWILMLFLVAL